MKWKIKQNKYKNKITEIDGIKFRSKLEADYYCHLKFLQQRQFIRFFLMQVPFHLPGGVKYVCDFQVFYADGTISFIDVKGTETKEFKMKKKMVECLYPVEIDIIKRGDF